MKRIILTLGLFLGMIGNAQAQEDTTRFTIGDLEFIILNKSQDTILVKDGGKKNSNSKHSSDDLTYWSGFEFGVSTLLNENGGDNFPQNQFLEIDPAQSFNYHFNLFEKRIRFGTDYVGLVTGLGFSNYRFGFKNNYNLMASADSTFAMVDATKNYSKNQLRATYLTVPLLLQFNTSKNEDKNFHIALGVIGGVRIGSKVVQKYDVFGGQQKDKAKGVYNLNPFQAMATARVGFNDFGIYANYSLLPLFEKNTIEQAFPLSFGLSLHF